MHAAPVVPEVLAPAGNEEMLLAAVLAGADAVYLGLESFNARRSAGNFTTAGLCRAVEFCHARDVRVYVALNTTLYQSEMPALAQAVVDIADAGVDAAIVQDMAVARMARTLAPGLVLHASTQMSVHSLAGAQFLARQGFARVILARELSLAEIEHITAHCGIETEVFVHGAQCMSVSGQCYMSAFLGGRSGNRGSCAGPCRLPFSASEPGACHLSLKDMSVIDHLPEIARAGVTSVKIEGRLRTPEYAAAAVNACKQELAGGIYDKQLLRDVFSRSGFTDGYLKGQLGGEMFGVRTGEDTSAAKAALPKLRALYRREYPRVAVDMHFTLTQDGAKLAVADRAGNKAVVYSEAAAQPAQKDLTCAITRALQKTGGTPFVAQDIQIEQEGTLYLPGAQINDMRRRALDQLMQKRMALHPIPCKPAHAAAALWAQSPAPARTPRWLVARFAHVAQIPASLPQNCKRVVVPLRAWRQVPASMRARTWLEAPRALFGNAEEAAMREISASRSQGFAGYVAENIAHLALLEGLPRMGGFGLNVTNGLAACAYAQWGLDAVTLLPELLVDEMVHVAPPVPVGAIAYGHMPLMITRACPLHNVHSCNGCPREGALLDRKDVRFPVRCSGAAGAGVRTIYNPVPLYMGDRQDQLPVDFLTLYFTTESAARAQQVIDQFCAAQPFDGAFTRGLYFKGTN